MQFSSAIIAASALAVANAASFTMSPYFFQNVVAGTALNLTWSSVGTGSTVSIYLKNGEATNLKTVAGAPVLSGLTGQSTTYTIPATLPDDTYAFEIDETGEPVNYSEQFALTGGVASTSSSASTSASSTSTGLVSSSTASTTGNSTTSASKTASTTSSSASKTGSSTTTSSTSTPSGLNSAAGLASPLALVFLAVAAVMTLQ